MGDHFRMLQARSAATPNREDLAAAGEAAKTDPGIVWHYTNGVGLISILSQHVLWATSAAFLNDADEVALGGNRIAQRLTELADGAADGSMMRKLATAITTQHDGLPGGGASPSRFFILSASRAWDSLAMWRNYGGMSESYAIGLDATSPLQVLSDGPPDERWQLTPGWPGGPQIRLKHRLWDPVRYLPHEQRALVDELVDDLPDQLATVEKALREHGPLTSIDDFPPEVFNEVNDILDDLEQALLLIKHEGFADEREIRNAVVLWVDETDEDALDAQARLTRHRATAYGIAPYLRLTGRAPGAGPQSRVSDTAAPLPIRAVAISPSPNGPLAGASVQQLLRANGYRGVPVLRSGIPFRG